jgi:hypothetical protein
MTSAIRLAVAVAAGLAASGCGNGDAHRASPAGRAFVEADRLFRTDASWLGADAAYSIPLAGDRVLWLFGDTFVATSARNVRSESKMVRNTVAIQAGADPRVASMAFRWGKGAGGGPESYFPDGDGGTWYWPGHGVRLAEGPLVVFLATIRGTPGEGLGFASAGWALAIVGDPSGDPADWKPRIVGGPAASFDAVPAAAVLREGAHVVGLAIKQNGTHSGALVRWPVALLARGDLAGAEWWAGPDRGWVAEARLGPGGPAFVIDDAGPECSLHRDARTGGFVHVASYGFGATTIGVRTASSLTGPWSAPTIAFRPPESDGPRPFVYAGKAHPELAAPTPDDLLVTYATNSFEFGDLFRPEGAVLYWPRFVAIRIR